MNGERPTYFILGADGRTPVAVADILTWARWFERGNRRVAATELSNGVGWISTVFLGIDHNWAPQGPPVLFETMGFLNDDREDFFDRYHTWAEAEAGHARIVEEAERLIQIGAEAVSTVFSRLGQDTPT